MLEKSFSRRMFLKTSAATVAVAGSMETFSFGDWLKKSEAAEVTTVASICGGCSAWCGMWIHVKNGRIWKVSGQKDNPTSKGKLCARGHASAFWAYTKDRITSPMRRTKDNWFEPVTWEQAYAEIGVKLKKVLAEHGPQTVFFSQNAKPTSRFYMQRFMDAVGSPTIQSHHSICSTGRDVACKWTTGAMATADIGKTKYILFLGRSYADGISPSATGNLADTRDKGTTVVIVDPRQNSSCAFATEWVPIRPGTDLALLLAIANVLIKEDLCDKDFIEEYTVGFDELRKAVRDCSPEWASELTTIPPETIYSIARGLGKNRPASCIEQGYKAPNGANYANGTQTFRALACVNALLGNYGRDGGMKFPLSPKLGTLDSKVYPAPPKPKVPRCDGAGIKGEYPLCQTSQGIPHMMPKRAMEGKAKAGFIYSFNPVRNSPDPEFMVKGYRTLDLMVVCDIQWSETAMEADYVLPECSFAEREDLPTGISGSAPGVGMRCQAINLVHPDTKPFEDIVSGMAQAMGFEKYFSFSRDQVSEAILAPTGVTLEELRSKGTIMLKAAPQALSFDTPSKKVEIYCQAFADNGFSPIPVWEAPIARADRNSFVLIHGKQGIMSHTATANIPKLLSIAKTYHMDRIWINGKRARQLGIKDGDLVEISSPLATRRIRVKVTERVHPEAAFLPAGYGNTSPLLKSAYGFGVNPNEFAPHRVEPIGGHAMMMEVVITVRKVGD